MTDFVTQAARWTGDYYSYLETFTDERSRTWLWISTPWPTLILTCSYLLMVWLGPKLMKHREPVNITWLLIPYNSAIALLNLYIGVELAVTSYSLSYRLICQPVSNIHHPMEKRMAAALWWYYFSKALEFFDTFSCILKKKNSQLTFLHVYHHSTMFCLWWMAVKWVPSGFSFFGPILNSAVHVVMYSYYALAALGPRVQKYLWWKKYLTMMQLVQFTLVMVATAYATCVGCEFPLWMQYLLTSYMGSFMILFINFYISTYRKAKSQKLSLIQKPDLKEHLRSLKSEGVSKMMDTKNSRRRIFAAGQ